MRSKDLQKEQIILKTALNMITNEGLAGLKMSNLARNGGMATGTLYIYFDSKEAMVGKLYEFVLENMVTDLVAHVDTNQPIREQLKQVCSNYLNELIAKPEYSAFLEQYLRSPYRSTQENELPIEIHIAPILELIKSNKQAHLLKSIDHMVMIQFVRGVIENYANQINRGSTSYSEEIFEQMYSFIWDGLINHPN